MYFLTYPVLQPTPLSPTNSGINAVFYCVTTNSASVFSAERRFDKICIKDNVKSIYCLPQLFIGTWPTSRTTIPTWRVPVYCNESGAGILQASSTRPQGCQIGRLQQYFYDKHCQLATIGD